MKRLLLLLFLMIFAHCAWAAGPPLRIGVLGPMSGSYANVGKEARHVLTLLTTDINDQGGLLGRNVELAFEDEGESAQAAKAAAEKLVRQGIVAVVGPFKSGSTESVQAVFSDAGLMQIAYGATEVSLTEKGFPYFFRTCPRDDEQAKALIKILRKTNLRKVALLHDNSLYGKGLGEAIQDQLNAWMMPPVFYGALTPNQADDSGLLEKVRETAPEVVFFAGYYPEAGRLLQARERLSWKVPFMGGDATNNPGLITVAGTRAAAHFFILSPPNPDQLENPRTKTFLNRFQQVYGYRPSSIYGLLAGNALLALSESIQAIQSADASKVSDYLHRRYFKKSGLTGEIFFNTRGDVVNDLYVLYQVDKEGRFLLKKQVSSGDLIP
ncbi:amino acid/amide ABC transporter substrate-binding protein, HAAT family [Syntrophus gentianae]|uniref:Amino acid/amide ABC transporter substrate-binding protein, HAAT family n=1 Tax=Syntrophus gentianae TaxID=43775 RepID=A0A1H7WN76_9BACT|nr:branched-chain amino acid ABC transporter substrate-binding protein [Syntrophus gentianae]SEM23042.1 amino acid/amide ABC transporter substrate-binding protein, HAAT family [Syntrophus gentianae]